VREGERRTVTTVGGKVGKQQTIATCNIFGLESTHTWSY
jgi:hypothetical protein